MIEILIAMAVTLGISGVLGLVLALADKITSKIKELINSNKVIIFVDEVETSFTELDNASYIEFRDVLDLCQIDVNDISRGSDYGD